MHYEVRLVMPVWLFSEKGETTLTPRCLQLHRLVFEAKLRSVLTLTHYRGTLFTNLDEAMDAMEYHVCNIGDCFYDNNDFFGKGMEDDYSRRRLFTFLVLSSTTV